MTYYALIVVPQVRIESPCMSLLFYKHSEGLSSAANPKPNLGVSIPLPAQAGLIPAKGRAT